MKILISCSLFFNNGNSTKYKKLYDKIVNTLHIFRNHGHEADIVIYYDNTVSKEIIQKLNQSPNTYTIKKNLSRRRTGCFWRYESVNDFNNYDIYMFRDIDLALENNDCIILNDFLNSDRNVFYTFVVHKRKAYPKQGFLMGGLFGFKKNACENFKQSLLQWKNSKQLGYYGSDEEFLAQIFYLKEKSLVFIEPRVKNAKLNETFFTKLKLETKHEKYIYLDKNYDF